MKRMLCILLAIVLMVCFVGCEHKGTGMKEGLIEKEFIFSEGTDDEHPYWTEHYEALIKEETWLQENGEFKYFVSAPKAWHGETYRLYAMITLPVLKASRWILETYDTETGQLETKEITYDQLGLSDEKDDGNLHYLTDIDRIDETRYMLQWTTVSEIEGIYFQVSDKRIYTDLNGETRQVELWDRYEELGMSETEAYDGSFIPPSSCLCDGRGNIYQMIRRKDGKSLLVFDENGNLLFDYRIPKKWETVDYLRTEEDEILFLFNDEKEAKQRIVRIDAENATAKEVASIPIKKDGGETITRICAMTGDTLYYETARGMVYSWNVENGERTLFMDYQENNLPSALGRLYVIGKDMVPRIRLYQLRSKTNEKPEEWIVTVSKENGNKRVLIDILIEDEGKKILTQAASVTAKRMPKDAFSIREITSKDQKDLLINELMAGNGPDILYVSRDDFVTLAEKGLLLDISTLLSKEINDRILPGAIGLGTYDGKLLGLPLCVRASSILVSRDIWNQDKWDIDDMLSLMREHKLDGRLYYGNAKTCFAPMGAFRMLIRNFLREPWLIDWEKGECHFDGERFVEFLALINDADWKKEEEHWLAEGSRLAYFDMAHADFVYEFGFKEEVENGYYVGFPTSGHSGNYLDADGILVICSGTKKTEEVKDLLSDIFSDAMQNGVDLSVLKMIIPETEKDENGNYYINGQEIWILQNGKSTIMTAKEFLEGCVAAPLHENELENIIMEEVEPYFMGKKTAQKTSEIIQNRVQLYLNERR